MISVIEREIKKYKQKEPIITKTLKKLSKKYNGRLVGLKYRLKKGKKLYGKAYEKRIENIRDILRYTIIFPEKNYVYGVYHVFNDLLGSGFKTKQDWIKQRWCIGDMYQGVNTSWESDGIVFELQFHTKTSQDYKTKGVLHDLYDLYNKHNCDKIYINGPDYVKYDCKSMRDKMNILEEEIPIPKGLEGKNCGLDIVDWAPLFKTRSKSKTKKKRNRKTKKTKKTNRRKKRLSKKII